MAMRLLRRISGLEPVAITSSYAPRAHDGHVDVSAGAAAPVVAPADTQPVHPGPAVVDVEPIAEATDFHPDTLLGGVPARVDQRPPVLRGTCYHHAHVDVARRGRLGLLIDGDRATLLPCPYTNLDGR